MQGMQSNTAPETRVPPALTGPLEAARKFRERQRESEIAANGNDLSAIGAPLSAEAPVPRPSFWPWRAAAGDAGREAGRPAQKLDKPTGSTGISYESSAKSSESEPLQNGHIENGFLGNGFLDNGFLENGFLENGFPENDTQSAAGRRGHTGQSLEAGLDFEAVFQFETELEAETTEDWLDLSEDRNEAGKSLGVADERTLESQDRGSAEEPAQVATAQLQDVAGVGQESRREWLDRQWLTRSLSQPDPAHPSVPTSNGLSDNVQGAPAGRSAPLGSDSEGLAAMLGYSVSAKAPDPKAVRAAIFRLAQDSGVGPAAGPLASKPPLREAALDRESSRIEDSAQPAANASVSGETPFLRAAADPELKDQSGDDPATRFQPQPSTDRRAEEEDLRQTRSVLSHAPLASETRLEPQALSGTAPLTAATSKSQPADVSRSGKQEADQPSGVEAGRVSFPRPQTRGAYGEGERPHAAGLSASLSAGLSAAPHSLSDFPSDSPQHASYDDLAPRSAELNLGPSRSDAAQSSRDSAAVSLESTRPVEASTVRTDLPEEQAPGGSAPQQPVLLHETGSAAAKVAAPRSLGEKNTHQPGIDLVPTGERLPELPHRAFHEDVSGEQNPLTDSYAGNSEAPGSREAGALWKNTGVPAAHFAAKATNLAPNVAPNFAPNLASGEGPALAHDASNLLSALKLYSELLSLSGVLQARHRHYAEDLKLLAGRSEVLIARLLQSISPAFEASVERDSGAAVVATAELAAGGFSEPRAARGEDAGFSNMVARDLSENRGTPPDQRAGGVEDRTRNERTALQPPYREASGAAIPSDNPPVPTPTVHIALVPDGTPPALQIPQPANDSSASAHVRSGEAQAGRSVSTASPSLHHEISGGEVSQHQALPNSVPAVVAWGGRSEALVSDPSPADLLEVPGRTEPPQELAPGADDAPEDRPFLGLAQAPQVDVAPINLVDLLTRWGSLLSMIAHGAVHIKFGPHAELPIAVAEEAMERILVNLVHNAMTATRNGGAIRIGVGRGETNRQALSYPASGEPARLASKVVLTVDDSGCGMSEEQIAKVLGRGEVPEASGSRTAEGTGGWLDRDWTQPRPDQTVEYSAAAGLRQTLDAGYKPAAGSHRHGMGLQIVRELVAASGGSLAIYSRRGVGTRIEIQWPALSLQASLPKHPGRIGPASATTDTTGSRSLLPAQRLPSHVTARGLAAGAATRRVTSGLEGGIAC